jgi:hypothetical protein
MRPDPPVGACCPHSGTVTVSPMQHPSYRESDEGWIYYHKFMMLGRGSDMRLVTCARPEVWRWKSYIRRCGACNGWFSNPWVPVCESCWDPDDGPFPSWERVIRWDMAISDRTLL